MTESPTMPPREKVIVGALLAVTLIAFVPGLVSNTFVFDDIRFIPHNRQIRDLGNAPRFFSDPSTMTMVNPGTTGAYDIYRPLRTLSFAVDWAIFGDAAVWYRIESLLWHLGAVFLAWLLLRRLFGDPLVAAIGAGLFALHPLQTQTVSWISSRGDVMCAVFMLSAAVLLLREKCSASRSACGVGLFALALFSKENAVALLLVVPAYDLLLSSRARIRWPLVAVMAAVTVAFVLIRNSCVEPQRDFAANVLLEAGVGTCVLVLHALFPVRLLVDTRDILTSEALQIPFGGLALGIAAAIVILAVVLRRRAPLTCFGVLWAAFCLGPVSGIIPLKSVAESRFAYLPLLGLGIVLGAIVRRLDRRGVMLGGAVLLLLIAGTLKESYTWTTSVTLWERARDRQRSITGTEAGGATLSNLASAYSEVGNHKAAIEMYTLSHEVHPTGETLANLGQAYWDDDQPEKAVETAAKAVELDPGSAITRLRLGTLLHQTGRSKQAVEHLRLAAEWAPDIVDTRFPTGLAYLAAGDTQQALIHLSAAARLAPDVSYIHVHLGLALHIAGALDTALDEYRRAAELEPNSPVPLLYAGRTLFHKGETREAILAFEHALDLDPSCHAARGERLAALALVQDGLPPEGIAILGQCLTALDQEGDRVSIQAILSRPSIWALGDVGLQTQYVILLLQTGNNQEARERLLDMRSRHPDNPNVLANLGLVEVQLGNPNAALPYLEKALLRDPESFVLHINMARAYRALGRNDNARKAAEKAVERAQNEAQTREARLFLAGGD